MAYGLWPMAHGVWHMAYGIWRMVYGLWPMAYGLWPMAYAAGYDLLSMVQRMACHTILYGMTCRPWPRQSMAQAP